jgi:hypothetical protein
MQHPTPIPEAVTYLLATGASCVVAVTQARFDPDMVAVLGAMLATVVAVLEARKKDRSMGHTVSVLIASAFVGSVLPGGVMWTWWPERVPALSWHVWAALGFIAGLLGWAFTAAVMALRSRVPGAVNAAADKFYPYNESRNHEKDPEAK